MLYTFFYLLKSTSYGQTHCVKLYHSRLITDTWPISYPSVGSGGRGNPYSCFWKTGALSFTSNRVIDTVAVVMEYIPDSLSNALT